MRGSRRTSGGVLVTALATALAGLAGTASAAPAGAGEAQAADIAQTTPVKWAECSKDQLKGVPPEQATQYSCARYRVPIDHDDASLGTIDIALMKRAAKVPGQRIGSLFLNPGGPGGSGLRMPIAGDRLFRPQVLDRFDLVGFDPRGVGDSNPLRCFTTAEDAQDVQSQLLPLPLSRKEISGTLAGYRDYGQFCRRNAGALLDHMSTRDVVRDLDQLRAAVGDRQLTYTGFSYGTLVGSTYAAMFPKQTRAIVIDGNVDPKLRTNDGVSYDLQRAQGFEIALDAFLKRCAQVGDKCAFSKGGDPRAKFDELREHVRTEPITLPGGSRLDLASLTNAVSGALYSPDGFGQLAKGLQQAYDALHPSAQSQSAGPSLLRPGRGGLVDLRPDSPYTGNDSYLGVNCADKPMRIDQAQVPRIAAAADRESPTFGRYQVFSDIAACPVWPAAKTSDPYRGPWRVRTATPVLVVSNFYDPATQYRFGQRMADELGNARLLSVDAFGHCILGAARGVDDAAAAYLIDLKVPADGQVFQPDRQPFTNPAQG
ncbi:alpha/beta hydrolase [Amycolatopsis jejuensis]|uniref:alpha/beta hydrolase n=1 Tax=Amycolatopsis jejuensis TaxID=330084 RepID=UPI001FE1B3B0|nr:alpha/beta hydrolase [Amycolatopsis jejuensis]